MSHSSKFLNIPHTAKNMSQRPDVRVIELGRESAAQESSIPPYPRLRGKQRGPAFLQDPTSPLILGKAMCQELRAVTLVSSLMLA